MNKLSGVELIAKERNEQIEKHKRIIESDVKRNSQMQLSFASALLNAPNPKYFGSDSNDYGCPEGWDKNIWMKMINKSYFERLIISGA